MTIKFDEQAVQEAAADTGTDRALSEILPEYHMGQIMSLLFDGLDADFQVHSGNLTASGVDWRITFKRDGKDYALWLMPNHIADDINNRLNLYSQLLASGKGGA
jgi:hypothetical protein